MKRFFLISMLTLAIYGFYSFQYSSNEKANEIVQREWIKQTETFAKMLTSLEEKIQNESVDSTQFFHLKLQYKRIEPFTAYFFPLIDKSINGAPLNTVFTDIVISDVEKPTGLQVLEEALFAEDQIQKENALNEIHGIQKKITQLQKRILQLNIQDRQVFEASRQEILRIETMGITGFDSPVFGNSLPGVLPALQEVELAISSYYDFATQQNSSSPQKLALLFENAESYLLQNTNFNSFNRLEFIREFMDPIYGEILQLHQDCQIETIDLVSSIPQKLNYFATQLFASDLLNPYAYTKVGIDEPSSSLALIGEKLFFDPILSANNERACASCHIPEKAFTDGYTTSPNFSKDGFLPRNSPTLVNASTQDAFFWDGRSGHLNDQIDHVALNPGEFNSSIAEVVIKVRTSTEYLELFSQAYNRKVTPKEFGIADIKSALSQYIKTLNSYESDFDKYMRKESSTIDSSVINGFNIFMGKATCATCHFPPTFYGLVPPLFEDSEFEVIGVPSSTNNTSWDTDLGRYNIYPLPFYKGSFKTPTVRNVTLTAPYMHNGVYTDLEQVVDFYNNGGGTGFGFNIPHQTLPSDSLHLTDKEQRDLIAFMESLTDIKSLNHQPKQLPQFTDSKLNSRPIGGSY